MSENYRTHVNPYNHTSVIGKLLQEPIFISNPNYKYSVIKVKALVPRDYKNKDSMGDKIHKNDAIIATGYISQRQLTFFKNILKPGEWVTIHGELRSVQYKSKKSKSPEMVKAQVFNLEDIQPLKIHKTDFRALTKDDKDRLLYAKRGLQWLIAHPAILHRFDKSLYKWMLMHDGFTKEEGNLELK